MQKVLNLSNMQPLIFIPNDPQNFLQEVLVEVHHGFLIFWYHWPSDGIVEEEQDYEPIMVSLNDIGERICYIGTRSHWRYRFHSPEEGLEIPLQILFKDSFHPALARTKQNSTGFDREKINSDLISHSYKPRVISPSEIPEKFRTGKDHPTAFLGNLVEDPKDATEPIHRGYCYHKPGLHAKIARKRR